MGGSFHHDASYCQQLSSLSDLVAVSMKKRTMTKTYALQQCYYDGALLSRVFLLFTPSFAIVDEGSNTPISIARLRPSRSSALLYKILLFLTAWKI